jgi:ADP-ribose pyrophosphatase
MDDQYHQLVLEFPHLFNNKNAAFKIILDISHIETWQVERRSELMRQGFPLSWADIGIILDDPYILVLRDLVKFPDNSLGGYIRLVNRFALQGGSSVGVLPVIENKILLLQHFRHATRSWHLEIPMGFGQPNSTPVENVRREVMEEISGEIQTLKELGIVYNAGMSTYPVHLFFARLSAVGKPEEVEGIKTYHRLSLAQFEDGIRSGLITDSLALAAYTHAKLQGLL